MHVYFLSRLYNIIFLQVIAFNENMIVIFVFHVCQMHHALGKSLTRKLVIAYDSSVLV